MTRNITLYRPTGVHDLKYSSGISNSVTNPTPIGIRITHIPALSDLRRKFPIRTVGLDHHQELWGSGGRVGRIQ